MSLLCMDGVSKSYGYGKAQTHVLEGIDLVVERGEFVAIVGYSGAGKTTLLSLLAGLLLPDTGSVTMKGERVRGPGPERGVVFQNYSLLPWLTVLENVMLAVDRVFTEWSQEKKLAHARRYIATVNLAAAEDKKPSALSGGMRQRVAVARALAMEPEVLLMDEPFGALDALTRATLQDELSRISRESGRTIVLVTNDVDEALLLADRIVPLGAGPKASFGPDVIVHAQRPRFRKTIHTDPVFKEARARVLEFLLQSARRECA